ncbi:MAG: hypothetical protein WCH34_07990 [Bacteroidota bacterium]
MKNTEQAELTRNAGLDARLTAESGNYTGNVKLIAKIAEFRDAYAENLACSAAAHPNNKGFSILKQNGKLALGETASTLSGLAYVALTDLGKIDVAEQLHINATDFTSVADSDCSAVAQNDHDVMFAHKTDLLPDVTDLMLTDFQDEITAFNGLQGTSETVHEVSPTLTKAFVASFRPVRKIIEQIKLLMKPYKKTNKDFYDRVMASTIIPAVNVHHTFVNISVVNKNVSKIVEGIVFTLTKAKKAGSTDWEGKLTIEKPRAGKDVLTGVLNGKVVYLGHIEIKRGRENDFDVQIDS